MRFVLMLSLLTSLALAGCGPSKPKPEAKPTPEPEVPMIEPPMPEPKPEPKPSPPVTPEKNPMPDPGPTPPATPEKKPQGTSETKPPMTETPATTESNPPPADVVALIESLKKTEARDGAVTGLKSKGASVVPSLVSALEKDSGEARLGLLLALGAFGKEAAAALPALKKIAASEKDAATQTAAQFTIDAIEGN